MEGKGFLETISHGPGRHRAAQYAVVALARLSLSSATSIHARYSDIGHLSQVGKSYIYIDSVFVRLGTCSPHVAHHY